MAVRFVCRACGKRLKLPDGTGPTRAAKCPKCQARIELDAALEASAYLPTLTPPEPPPSPEPPLLGADDPLPYPAPKSPPARAGAAPAPLPFSPGLKPPTTPTPTEEPLSLDDDQPGEPTAEVPLFRVPVWVLADSARQVVGPCFAVLVPHGLFLEHEPMKPFLYAPPGCRAESPAAGELLVVLPERRTVALRFEGRASRALARDARAFLAGARPVPLAADYQRKWWLLWAALILALGLVGGPLALARTADLGPEFGLKVGAGFALVGLLANAAVALFCRWSVPGRLALMVGVCALVSGVFLFGATAYLAGRRKATEEMRPEPNPPGNTPSAPDSGPNPPVPGAPPASTLGPPSHVDRAYTNGASALDDGPADVTALTVAPDGNTLGIGHADGTTRLCLLDQPTFDSILPGPRADGPVNRVRFDKTSRFVFAVTPTSAVATTRGGPFVTLARIPGTPVAIAPELAADRVRYTAVRGNAMPTRVISTAFIQRPPVKAGDAGIAYALPGKGDEAIPAGSGPDPARPGGAAGPTFLAWTPGGKLLAGQPDGTISIWSNALRPEAPSRDHKAPVKVWADCPGTGDFATGDDRGYVAWWPYGGGKPTVYSVLATPIAALAFAPSGAWLAVADTTGWLVIWDVAAGKAVHRTRRPSPAKVMAFGPNDDVLILAAGKTVEVWWLPELVK